MKKQLHKKFLAISVIAILFSASANAQIVYTDVNPDVTSTSTNSTYNLDLNNDGIFDVSLSATNFIDRTGIRPPIYNVTANGGLNQSTQILSSTSKNGLNLGANSLIEDASQTWSNSTAFLGDHSPCASCWPLNVDRFLGVRFSVGGNWFYGWVRLSIARSSSRFFSFTVRDYTYNSSPNQPILAGQTSALGLSENPLVSQINIFPNPASNQVTISLGSLQQEIEVAITDTTGKIVYKTKESEAQNIEVNTTDFANGIYLVQIKAKDYVTTKKLVVNK